MSITTLFRPELKLSLETLIQDQVRVRKIAEALIPLGPTAEEPLVKETLSQITSSWDCDEKVIPLFHQLIIDELHNPTATQSMTSALMGITFTVKNALIAQTEPKRIRESQTRYKLPVQEEGQIRQEGREFIRESLRYHLEDLSSDRRIPFRDQLNLAAHELIPFVRETTRRFLRKEIYSS